MTVHNLNLQTISKALLSVTNVQPSVAVPTQPGHATRWSATVVDMFGNPYATLPVVGNPTITWPLDAPVQGVVKFSFDTDVTSIPLANAALSPPREIQLYRNGVLILWGPAVARSGSTTDRVWEYTVYDPLWYLQHRYFGEAARHNYISNGGFEVDLTGWTAVGTTTATRSTTQKILGVASAKVVSTVSAGQDYIRFRFPMTATSEGLALFLTAWVYVESFTAGAYGDRGAYIERQSTPGTVVTDLQAWAQAPLTKDSAPVGKWSRLSTFVEMPPNATETIEVRLYAPNGTAYWDAVTVTIAESLSLINGNSAGGLGWDQTLIAQMVVKYLSGALPIGAVYTKSNLNIAVAGDPSGITKQRTYLFSDHQNGFDALTQFTTSSDGFDFRVDVTPTKRVFRTFYPAVGNTWTGLPFTYRRVLDNGSDSGRSRSWGIVKVEPKETIEGSASDITEMGGWGTGAGREEAAFSDPSVFGGLTIELVEASPTEAPIDLLSAIAASRGSQLGKVQSTPVFTMIEPKDPQTGAVVVPLIGVMLPGDLFHAIVDDGSLQIDGVVRVAQVVLNEDETLSVTVNP